MLNNSYVYRLFRLTALICSLSLSINTQATSSGYPSIKDTLYSGYYKDISGEILNYHSCHPEANSSLLIRCLNNKDEIEWETDKLQPGNSSDTLTFCWIGGFSTGTSTAEHIFHMYINENEKLSFKTVPKMPLKNWTVKGKNGYVLDFMFVAEDHVKDHFGYFFLKVPKSLLPTGSLRIKVKGDASGSRDWYMTMRYTLKPRFSLQPEEAILKGERGEPQQRLKISLDHFTLSEDAEIKIDGRSVVRSRLNFGVNDFIVPVNPVTEKKDINVEVLGETHRSRSVVTISPVRSYKVFILPHSHVDIGYTDIQPVVARVHADNMRKAMHLIAASEKNPAGSRFKWNVEMLWEAESFLQTATQDEKKFFFDRVREGSIGLEGMYAGVMTGLCRDEELYHLFDYKFQLEKENQIVVDNAMITDIPGYSWGLIPVMAQCGIRYFSIGPNTGDRIGNTIKAWGDKPFWWVSPSGKEKVLFWMSSRGYSLFHKGSLAKSDGSQILEYLSELSRTNYAYDLVQLRYTVGGDNGYPDSLLPAYVKDWNEKYISPKLAIATSNEMFKEFEGKYGSLLPSYQGDFSPYWEDGAASTARETALNRWSAEKLTQAATLWAINRPGQYPEKDILTAWNNVILYSEHTWGAWNSTSDPDLANVKDQWEIKKGFADAADLLSGHLLEKAVSTKSDPNRISNTVSVFNTSSWDREGLVYLPSNRVLKNRTCLADEKGKCSHGQLLSSGLVVYRVEDVPALAKKEYLFVNDPAPADADLKVLPTLIENRHLLVRLDSVTGEIKSLKDKRNGKEWCNNNEGYGMNSYWYTGQNGLNPKRSGETTLKVLEKGPVVATIQVTSEAAGCEKIIREISLVAGDDKVWIKNRVFKNPVREKENVRFAFPFELKDPEVRMDMAWFILEPGKNQLPGSNANYYTVQRWLDVSNDKDGISVATPDAPLWETGHMTGENWLDPKGNHWMEKPDISSTLFSWVMNNSWHTNFKADQEGEVVFNYVIQPHGRFDGEKAYRLGIEVSQPLLAVPDKMEHSGASLPSCTSHEDIVVTAVFPVIDEPGAFIYRFYNLTAGEIEYNPFTEDVKMVECSPDGKILSGTLSVLKFRGHEIKTVKVSRNP